MMRYEDFKSNYTHLFRCIKFPERWDGRRIAGSWTQDTAGGNYKLKTWQQNPCYTIKVYEDTNFFFSLSGSDDRLKYGKDYNLHTHPFGFHICKYDTNTRGPVNPRDCYKQQKYDGAKMVPVKQTSSLTIPGSIETHPGVDHKVHNNTDQAPYKFHHATSTWVTLAGPGDETHPAHANEANCYRDDAKGNAQKSTMRTYNWWFCGFVVLLYCGIVVLWYCGFVVLWCSVAQWCLTCFLLLLAPSSSFLLLLLLPGGETVPGEGMKAVQSNASNSARARPYALYCIVPSMYSRIDKNTKEKVTGSFFLSVYGDAAATEKATYYIPVKPMKCKDKDGNPDICDPNELYVPILALLVVVLLFYF